MTCYHPIQAFVNGINEDTGKKRIVFEPKTIRDVPLALPCGKCIGCRLEKTRQWAVRGMAELITTKEKGYESCFLTLTYSDKYYPKNGCLKEAQPDIQKFIKRLRARHPEIAHYDEDGKLVSDIRFFYSGEYTPTSQRPHWHIIVYGYDFPDKEPIELSDSGKILYHSKELEFYNAGKPPLWNLGIHRIGDVEYDSIRYVAKYITKKLDGVQAHEINEGDFLRYYERFIPDTSEIVTVSPEYCETPRRPGLGHDFLVKYWDEIYPSESIVFNKENPQRTTKYFDKLLEDINPDLLEKVINDRRNYVLNTQEEHSKERMDTKEGITKRKHKRYLQEIGEI